MKLAHYMFREMINFTENKVYVLIIEQPYLLRKTIDQLEKQTQGESGEYVLSNDQRILEFHKKAELITDPFHIAFDQKKILTKLQKNACEESEAFIELVQELFLRMNELGSKICTAAEYDLTFSAITQAEQLIRILNFQIDAERLSMAEQLLEYMKIMRSLFGKELFILINLKSFLTKDELMSFYKAVQYEKFTLLLIESFQKDPPNELEIFKIIDQDLCEI